ncbi:MAG: DUF3575 domain-containing protein [Fluviicola sp.]|nr:DUF3575 domain-containing protein [Fluviicola sp.]
MNKIITALVVTIIASISFGQEESTGHSYSIKFAPIQLIAGEFNFTYEQRLTKFTSLELELGPTFSEVGLSRGNHNLWNTGNPESAIGFHGALGFRLYPLCAANEMSSLYLEPQFKYRRYNSVYTDDNYNAGDITGNLDQLIFRFNLGYQFWASDRLAIDLYAGIGMGNNSDERYDLIYDGVSGAYTWKANVVKRLLINGTTGIRIGFGK